MHSYFTAYPLISWYLSYTIHWYKDNYHFISCRVSFLSIYFQPFYPVKYLSLYLFFIQTYPFIHALISTAYPLTSWHLSYRIHGHPAAYPFISSNLSSLSRFHIHSYSLLSIDTQDLVFSYSCLLGRSAWSGPSIACPAHQWGKPVFFFPGAPRCGHRLPPGQQRLRLGARRRSGTGSSRLLRRRRISAASAGSYAGVNIPTKNTCRHQLSWCSGPNCSSVCARYLV